MIVRAYDSQDRAAVIALWHACGLVAANNDPGADIDLKLTMQPELFLVGERSGEVVATVMAGFDGHRGWINYLATSPDHQREGLGREMMQAAEVRLVARGCPKINLQIRGGNTDVRGFYESLGYEVEDRISMGKRISSAALRYRPATDTDVQWLLALRRSTMDPHLRASGDEPREDVHRDAVLKDFDATRIILLANDEVGMIKLVRSPAEWHLRQIQIAPEFQKRGLGQAVLHEMLGEARASSVPIVLNVLKANPAKDLYARLGFAVVDEDERAFKMQWHPLADSREISE